MAKKSKPSSYVNVGTTALVLDDGRRVEPGASLPKDTPEDRREYWERIGALGPGKSKAKE